MLMSRVSLCSLVCETFLFCLLVQFLTLVSVALGLLCVLLSLGLLLPDSDSNGKDGDGNDNGDDDSAEHRHHCLILIIGRTSILAARASCPHKVSP